MIEWLRRLFTPRAADLLRDNGLLWQQVRDERRRHEDERLLLLAQIAGEREAHFRHDQARDAHHLEVLGRIDEERVKTDYESMCRLSDAKTALDKAEKERDYFRARADRLELELLGRRTSVASGPPRPLNMKPVGRTRWQELQHEAELANAELDRQEAAAKAAAAAETQAAPQPDAEPKTAAS